MTRHLALSKIKESVQNENTVKHMLATEAILRALARRLGQDEESWGLAGLFHDVDLELTNGDMNVHSRVAAQMAQELGAPPEVAQAILVHNEAHGQPRLTLLDKALYCADPLTGLITAAALVRPDKKLAGVTADSVAKRFREKRFAMGANREQIALCSELGLELNEFLALGLEAMQGVAEELGL